MNGGDSPETWDKTQSFNWHCFCMDWNGGGIANCRLWSSNKQLSNFSVTKLCKGRGFIFEVNNSTYSKRQADKCWWESLCQDDLVRGLHVIHLPPGHLGADLLHAAGHHIAGHGEESRRQNWLNTVTWSLLYYIFFVSVALTCARRPYLTSLRQTAWSSRLQSQPGMLSSKAWY